jgi:hypothetical protein
LVTPSWAAGPARRVCWLTLCLYPDKFITIIKSSCK